MNKEELYVNHKTVIEEFKRKHNYLVDSKVQKITAPTSTTLTDEQIAQIREGVFIEGVFGTLGNPILLPANESGGVLYGTYLSNFDYGVYQINLTTKVFSLMSEAGHYIKLRTIEKFNGKTVPDFPASNVDKYLKSLQGSLKWDDINLADIVDSQGNKRFVEGDIAIETITGVKQTYGKWSLSGTHLMIVLGYTIEDATTISGQKLASIIDIPQWILDKIIPLYFTTIEATVVSGYSNDGSTIQSLTHALKKESNGLQINIASITTTAKRNFRISFDLLIDTEEPVSAGE